MTILLADGVCPDCGDRPDPGRSSHRPSLLEEIYSAAHARVQPEQNLFLLKCFGAGTETPSSGGFSQLSALSRVISLDLIDLDAQVGTGFGRFSATAVSPTASTSDAGRPRTP